MFEQSINITNPIEIALLYAQSCDAICDGSHPCDINQASTVSILYTFRRNHLFEFKRLLLLAHDRECPLI